MKGIPSLLRLEEHKALSRIELSGRILDLGGDKNSEYLRFFKGEFETTTVNFGAQARPDIVHDLEQPLPLADDSYDHVLLFNVLEHIFEYRKLLQESVRVLKPGGSMVVVVPFLFPVHPSPEDYHRFTASTLRKEMELLGLRDIEVQALGGGVHAVCYVLLDRLLPRPLRFISFYTLRYIARGLDVLMTVFARAAGKKYNREDYALGFCATGIKI